MIARIIIVILIAITTSPQVHSQLSQNSGVPYYLRRHVGPLFKKNEVIVKYKDKSGLKSKQSLNKISLLKHKKLDRQGHFQIQLQPNENIDAVISDLSSDPNIEYAQPNFKYKLFATVPNDPKFSQLWGLRNTGQTIVAANGPDTPNATNNPGVSGKDMGLSSAWDQITDCGNTIVAVIDSGVNYDHEDLSANMWNGGVTYPNHGYDFVDNDNDPQDLNGHGTHVASTIGAVGNNSSGSTGVCWNVKIMALRVADSAGSISTAEIVQAVDFAVAQNADVINMSLGGPSFDNAFNSSLTAASSAGLVVVVAAGNEALDNEQFDSYPCNYTQTNIICVAAVDQNYEIADFSNFGTTSVDIAAPGVNIVSAWNGTTSATTDALTSGWTMTSVNSNTWAYKTLNFSAPTAALVVPASYDGSTANYINSADDRVWKTFNTLGGIGTNLNFSIMWDAEQDQDGALLYIKEGTGDPIPTGTVLDAWTGSSDGYRYRQTLDISSFASTDTTIGFRFLSDATVIDVGVNVTSFFIENIFPATNYYNVLDGTSMATPHVAGLAALLIAYNPNYTSSDVVNAILKGGITTPGLSSKVVTGKTAHAHGALTYIAKPTGVTAAVQ